MLLNIAFADLLTGLVSDTVSISFHTKEGLGQPIQIGEIKLLHCGLFLINGASILTMSLLCVDRVLALLKPLKYRKGMKEWKLLVMLSSTWITSSLLIIPYFNMGYIKYLAVFSYTTVSITGISLVVAMVIYRKYFAPFKSTITPPATPNTKQRYYKNRKKDADSSNNGFEGETSNAESKLIKSTVSLNEKRVNKSFIALLLVFLVTYLPACIMTAYMNLCQECNCMLIHALRDLTYLSILSSALLRPLNFVIRLRTLNKAILKVFGFKTKQELVEWSSKGNDSIHKSQKNSCNEI